MRRLLALAAIDDGVSRADTAQIGGVNRQMVRDWLLRFNADGPTALLDRAQPVTAGATWARAPSADTNI